MAKGDSTTPPVGLSVPLLGSFQLEGSLQISLNTSPLNSPQPPPKDWGKLTFKYHSFGILRFASFSCLLFPSLL